MNQCSGFWCFAFEIQELFSGELWDSVGYISAFGGVGLCAGKLDAITRVQCRKFNFWSLQHWTQRCKF